MERQAFKQQIDQMNAGFGDGAGVEFVPLGWEDIVASTGRRVQSVINQEIDTCDAFVLAMHRRWGQPAPDSAFSSYTEEEFQRALERFRQTSVPEIFVFFKNVDAASVADPGPELSKVLKFRLELERARTVRYRTFAETSEFAHEVDRHLRAFVKGELPAATIEPDRLPLPLELVERVERVEAEARKRAEEAEAQVQRQSNAAQAAIQKATALEARTEALISLLAIDSAKAAGEGSVEKARQLFANATIGTTNSQILFLAFQFYWQAGPLTSAEDMLQRWLAVNGWETKTAQTAEALRNLGVIYQIQKKLARAEELYRKALAISEALADPEQMAMHYGSLGGLYLTSGDLERAEAAHRRALAVLSVVGRSDLISAQYTGLALIAQSRGDADASQQFHLQALRALAPTMSLPGSVVRIPVVVHVVYRDAGQNLSDAQINSQIGALNRDFRAQNKDLFAVPFAFQPTIGDARIEFHLAQIDPMGQPTRGITRTRTRRKDFGFDDAIKKHATGGADAWDPERYLNLWLGPLQGGILAYAQFPGGPGETDGVVVSTNAFGTRGTAQKPFDRGRMATHTVAQYFGVRHIWERDGAVPDTPEHAGPNFGSPQFPLISGNNGPYGDMFMNFMDYVDDEAMHMFTKHQVLRMHETLRGPRQPLSQLVARTPAKPSRSRKRLRA